MNNEVMVDKSVDTLVKLACCPISDDSARERLLEFSTTLTELSSVSELEFSSLGQHEHKYQLSLEGTSINWVLVKLSLKPISYSG